MRTEFTSKTKDAAFDRCGGFCEGCGLPLAPGKIVYDHIIPDWTGGDNTLENCQVLGWCCNKPKTAKDQGTIAKVKRLIRRARGIKKPRSITGWRNFKGEIVHAKDRR